VGGIILKEAAKSKGQKSGKDFLHFLFDIYYLPLSDSLNSKYQIKNGKWKIFPVLCPLLFSILL
jgi:hypothetical protein